MTTRTGVLYFLLCSTAAIASQPVSNSPPAEVVRLSNDVSWLYRQALPELKAKRYADVIRDSTKAVDLTKDPKALSVFRSMRASAYNGDHEYQRALEDGKEARRLFPSNAWAWLGCARAENGLENFEEAIADANKALQLDPKYAAPYAERGYALHSQGHYAAAITDYRRALESRGHIENLAVDLAAAEIKAGMIDQAIVDLKKALAVNPRDAETYDYLGNAYFRKGEYELALSATRHGLDLNPRDEHLLNAMAWIRATCPAPAFRNGREAETMARQACQKTNWRNPHLIDTWAAANAELGDFSKAVEAERKALALPDKSTKSRSDIEEHLRLFEQGHPVRDKGQTHSAG